MTARWVWALCAVACIASELTPEQLYGRWKVTSVPGAGPVTAITGTAAARLVGRLLVVKPQHIQFQGQTCRPTYDSQEVSSAGFMRDNKVDPKTLKLPDPVTTFDAGCMDIFVREPGKIVFTWKGFFLEATKLPVADLKTLH